MCHLVHGLVFDTSNTEALNNISKQNALYKQLSQSMNVLRNRKDDPISVFNTLYINVCLLGRKFVLDCGGVEGSWPFRIDAA